MNQSIIDMLEDIKKDKYTTYCDYLDEDTIRELQKWFSKYSSDEPVAIERIVDLLYELYTREDIDFHPVDEYQCIVSSLAQKYHFNSCMFLELYTCFRSMVFEATA